MKTTFCIDYTIDRCRLVMYIQVESLHTPIIIESFQHSRAYCEYCIISAIQQRLAIGLNCQLLASKSYGMAYKTSKLYGLHVKSYGLEYTGSVDDVQCDSHYAPIKSLSKSTGL